MIVDITLGLTRSSWSWCIQVSPFFSHHQTHSSAQGSGSLDGARLFACCRDSQYSLSLILVCRESQFLYSIVGEYKAPRGLWVEHLSDKVFQALFRQNKGYLTGRGTGLGAFALMFIATLFAEIIYFSSGNGLGLPLVLVLPNILVSVQFIESIAIGLISYHSGLSNVSIRCPRTVSRCHTDIIVLRILQIRRHVYPTNTELERQRSNEVQRALGAADMWILEDDHDLPWPCSLS